MRLRCFWNLRYVCGEYYIRFIVVHDEETYISIQGHERELTCAFVVDNSSDLVCKCSKAEDICNWCVFDGVEAVVVGQFITVVVWD